MRQLIDSDRQGDLLPASVSHIRIARQPSQEELLRAGPQITSGQPYGKPRVITPLKDLMVVISEAYKTLGNEEKRAAYDKRLAAMGGFSMHREKTDTAESIEGWHERANECLRAKLRWLDCLVAQMR